MKEKVCLSVCILYWTIGIYSKLFHFLKAKCFHYNAFFNDFNAKEPEVETPVKWEEMKEAKEARSDI
jgi:hypothetical protein